MELRRRAPPKEGSRGEPHELGVGPSAADVRRARREAPLDIEQFGPALLLGRYETEDGSRVFRIRAIFVQRGENTFEKRIRRWRYVQ
jgi:hypothetical protein